MSECIAQTEQRSPGVSPRIGLGESQIKCWGENADGQLGQGDRQARGGAPGQMGDNLPFTFFVSEAMQTMQPIVALASGPRHNCAILGRSLKCWGRNAEQQLGIDGWPSITDRSTFGDRPGDMAQLPAIDFGADRKPVAMALGDAHTCVMLDDSRIKCWGDNGYGQLGLGDSRPRLGVVRGAGSDLPDVDVGP
jgi:alpha-tubulin suppressor-like RCC1 family protein